MHRRILILLHSETSTPGRIGRVLVEKGFSLDVRRPCLGEALPQTLAEHAGVVILGGPMSANDSDPFVREEIDFIGVPLKEKKPFLGVCLGAQMLARHLGSPVGPHPDGWVEIGYYPLVPTDVGQMFGPWPEHVYHWHREGFDLPSGAERLASSETYENQAIRYGTTAFGIQFHPEVTRLMMHRWSVLGARRLVLKGARLGSTHLEHQLLYDAPVKTWLRGFLDHWLATAPAEMQLAAE